ncbi:MAG TPA: glycerol-3-phosphate dehydrogenase/oxidase [Candidatus Polarisedimenticolaceae bacterium]|nr:glycerol-3-phosphate dehydrogenase/oxidase [Candidatus Polarisedimenticolaceae bacterium]
MRREEMLERVRARGEPWDLLVIGGGATGVGVALDAAARGYAVLLLERADFGQGTSSRSTKLIHGGVRYLRQGNLHLVRESLRERAILRDNAPHLVEGRSFLVPAYAAWERAYYGVGLSLYSLLAGKRGFGPSRVVSRDEALSRVPALSPNRLRGGVVYHDGQFDDARLLVHLAMTAAEHGALLVNHAPVDQLTRDATGTIDGASARDLESGETLRVKAKAVVNAAGPFGDMVRRLADPGVAPSMSPSQGIHLVLDRSFLGGDDAILVPRTEDGRVLFAIPWHGHVLAGTTDTPIGTVPDEPKPLDAEVDLVLRTLARYLRRPPQRPDVLSAFAGIRPLLRAASGRATSKISREHAIRVEAGRLVTITGGKWTTYRAIAEEVVTSAAAIAGLPARRSRTVTLRVHGHGTVLDARDPLAVYGSDAAAIRDLGRDDPALARALHPALPYTGAEIVWAARYEMARTVEDALARRTRALYLNAGAAAEMAPEAARLLARELGRDAAWVETQVTAFRALARDHTVSSV